MCLNGCTVKIKLFMYKKFLSHIDGSIVNCIIKVFKGFVVKLRLILATK